MISSWDCEGVCRQSSGRRVLSPKWALAFDSKTRLGSQWLGVVAMSRCEAFAAGKDLNTETEESTVLESTWISDSITINFDYGL
jgi:hypothetical protein